MIAATATLEFVSTKTETEALLLEANLIKRLRPRFNVLLRDDKSFPYILITYGSLGAADPQASRRAHAAGPLLRAVRFGRRGQPHHQRAAARVSAALLLGLVFREPARGRACCIRSSAARRRARARSTSPIIAELVREANAFLSGRSQAVKDELAGEMDKASAALDFERAAIYRDRLAALSAIQSHQGINPRSVEEADVFAVHQDGGYTASKCSSSAPGRTGATAPISRKPTGRSRRTRCSAPSSRNSTTTSRRRGSILSRTSSTERELLAEALARQEPDAKSRSSCRSAARSKELVEHALANAREALGAQARRHVLAAKAARRR